SLVNPATHSYDRQHVAQLSGWRRVWRHRAGGKTAFLAAVRGTGVLEGMIFQVADADWPALDIREATYLRERVTDVTHPLPPETDVSVYHAPDDLHPVADEPLPILLSYLDVVVQGYLRAFGESGVADFFETTDGWDAPILDDRDAPRYPRHQVLTTEERRLTDDWIAKIKP
ncbi:MAG: gamma-glutamylcyclotransferase, partial [Pseudomonadota bacterium]